MEGDRDRLSSIGSSDGSDDSKNSQRTRAHISINDTKQSFFTGGDSIFKQQQPGKKETPRKVIDLTLSNALELTDVMASNRKVTNLDISNQEDKMRSPSKNRSYS